MRRQRRLTPLYFVDADSLEMDALRVAYHATEAPAAEKLTSKQRDLLRLLSATREPLAAKTMYCAFAGIERDWEDYSAMGISMCLDRLERRGFVDKIRVAGKGNQRVFWSLAEPEYATNPPASLEAARRARELAELVAEQEYEKHLGDRVVFDAVANVSLDDPGDTDRTLLEQIEDAA
jgi:hypothetical protein